MKKGTESMKWRFSVFAVFLLTVMFAPSLVGAGTLDRIQSDGILRLGVRVDAAPFAYRDDLGEANGFTVDLCRAVAKNIRGQLGLTSLNIEYVDVTAENRFESLQKNQIDLLCGATSATLSRREIVDFSIHTFIDGAGVIFRKDGPTNFEGLAGKRVGVRMGTTTEAAVKNTLMLSGIDAEVVAVTDHNDGFAKISDRQIDAYFADRMILVFLLGEHAGSSDLLLSKNNFSYEPYALALQHGDSAFRLAVDRALSQIYRSGAIETIYRSTFGQAQPSEALRHIYLVSGLPG
jgi:polar amino acid transport system substrate-binding protein/glutamate/aspartate transport system substrate-binding protein